MDMLKFEPIGSHYDGTAISSAVTLTPPDGAYKLVIQALGQKVRLTLDGTTPTAARSAGWPPSWMPWQTWSPGRQAAVRKAWLLALTGWTASARGWCGCFRLFHWRSSAASDRGCWGYWSTSLF
jgi:hypothetical protein